MNDEKDDSVIRERRFKIGANIDIGDLGLGDDSEEVAEPNSPSFDKNETVEVDEALGDCLLYTSPSPRDQRGSRMPSSA